MNKKTKLFFLGGLILALALGLAAIALANNGNPSTTVPSSGNTTTGPAAGMFGSVSQGLTVYNASCAACHGSAGQPTLAYPGLASVQNPNTSYSMDSQLYDPNPALFARNIDCFIQHGSNPVGPPSPMPSFGDSGTLTQTQIANVEAYVMSLSNVNWPTLSLSSTSLTGSNFVPQTLVQLYQNDAALGSAINTDAGGNLAVTFSPPAGQSGTITAKYAVLDEPGIYANNVGSTDLAMDSTRGAAYTIVDPQNETVG